jgi:L-alanine-DL-glutamate epimerase-like enolase superfamily enzyme
MTLPNVGGITEFMKISALCETHYVGMIPHFTGPVALAALAHTLCAFPGPALMETVGDGPKLPPHLTAGCAFREGKLWPVDRPGLGVEFDPQGAERILEVTEHAAPIPQYRRPDGSFTNW